MSQSSEIDIEGDLYLIGPIYVHGARDAGCVNPNEVTHPIWRKMLGHVWKEKEGKYMCTYCDSKALPLPVEAHFVFEASELLLIARLQAELK